jgi:hypothetical protein
MEVGNKMTEISEEDISIGELIYEKHLDIIHMAFWKIIKSLDKIKMKKFKKYIYMKYIVALSHYFVDMDLIDKIIIYAKNYPDEKIYTVEIKSDEL